METKINKKTLVIVNDDEAFKSGKSLVLLGEWCDTGYLVDSNNTDIEYVSHPLSYPKERESHYHYIQKTLNHFLTEITNLLNTHHKVAFTNKIWKMLLGNYILTLSHIVYVKWLLIQNALIMKNIETVRLPLFDDQDAFIPNHLKEYSQLMLDEGFLAYLTKNIILKINPDIKKEEFHLYLNEINVRKKSLKQSLKFYLFYILGKYLVKFNPNPKLFFYLTSMSRKSEIHFNLKLFQIPFIHPFQDLKTRHVPNHKIRTKLKSNNYSGFEKILYELLWDFLPISLLEGFSSNYNLVSEQTKKFNPNTIVTSMDGIMSSESFLLYLASKGKKRPKVISLQHGGVYGTAKYNSVEDHEIDVSDYFLSWGWKTKKNVIPSYIHKHLGFKKRKVKLGSNLIFINYCWAMHDYRIASAIMSSDMVKYFDDQKTFFKGIKPSIKNKLCIRFFKENFGWETKKRLRDHIKIFHISKRTYLNDLNRARMVVQTYNSTSFLETLTFDIPTVAFFNPDADRINDHASKYFKWLSDVGILYYDPLSAANFINFIWDDVESWWYSEDVQKARKSFVREFANLTENSENEFFSQLIQIYHAGF